MDETKRKNERGNKNNKNLTMKKNIYIIYRTFNFHSWMF